MIDGNGDGSIENGPQTPAIPTRQELSGGPELSLRPEIMQPLPGETSEQTASRLGRWREHLAGLEADHRAAIQRVRQDPTGATLDALAATRDSRLAAKEASKPKTIKGRVVKRVLNSAVGKGVRMLVEMVPGGLGPYGIGDAIALGQAITGRDTGLNRLDRIDRGIYLVGAAIPIVPALPFVGLARRIRHHTEDAAHVIGNRRKAPPPANPPATH